MRSIGRTGRHRLITATDPLAAAKFILKEDKIAGSRNPGGESIRAFFNVRRREWRAREPYYLYLLEWVFPLPWMFRSQHGPVLTTADLQYIEKSNVGLDYFTSCYWHVFDWITEDDASEWSPELRKDMRRILSSTCLVSEQAKAGEMADLIMSRVDCATSHHNMSPLSEEEIDEFYVAAGRARIRAP